MPEFAPVITLSTLNGNDGFEVIGELPYDNLGYSVSCAGDINGDGLDDIIIGAARTDLAYVILGRHGGFAADLALSELDGTNGFQISGEPQSSRTAIGRSVSSAGDVNGDGIDDLILGAPYHAPAGSAYVVFGKTGGFGSNIELSSLDGANGFRIEGIGAGDRTGYSVASAGDINGDGFDDLIIGASSYGDPTGASFVVFGQPDDFAPVINLSALNGSDGFRILGLNYDDRTGCSVASIGDMNGDGFDDIVIGARYADPHGQSSGTAYVVFGKSGGFTGDIDLNSLNGTNGFKFTGHVGDYVGNSVASAGDVNGDGIDDVIIAGYNTHIGGIDTGAAFVIFGKTAAYPSAIDLNDLDGENGYRIAGNIHAHEVGSSVASAGDVNGDGFDDIIIGAKSAYGGGAFVVFGRAGRPPSHVDVSSLTGETGFRISGSGEAYDYAGTSVSSAGDINGDGFDDLIVGAPGFYSTYDLTPEGNSYVVFGHRAFEAVSRIGTNIGQTINGGMGQDQISGLAGDDTLKGWEAADTMWGGLGNDVYVLEDANGSGGGFPLVKAYDTVIESPDEGIDTVKVLGLDVQVPGPDGYQLGANVENGIVTGTRSFGLSGNELDNQLTGNSAFNTLRGFEGNDLLSGSSGLDQLRGGLGNDIFMLADISASGAGFAFDDVEELLNEGTDTVRIRALDVNPAGADLYDLPANVENGVITGTLKFGLRGNELNNHLTGNAQANVLSGLAGNDTVTGGLGRDIMRGGGGDDRFDFNAVADSGKTPGSHDAIADFTINHDDIDLATIDAIPGGANSAFAFIGTGPLTEAGQVRIVQSGSDAIVEINTIGTTGAEMTILLAGVSAATLDSGDFRL